MIGRQVVERTKHGLLITQEAVAHPLLGDQPLGGFGYLAECGVHAKEGQQGDDDQLGEAGVAVVGFALVLGQELADAELSTSQGQDHDCRDERADETEGEQDQRQPGAEVAGDHRDPQGELRAQPAEQIDRHDRGQQPPPDAPGVDDQDPEVGPQHPSILNVHKFAWMGLAQERSAVGVARA